MKNNPGESNPPGAGSSGCGVSPEREAELNQGGWERRTTLDEPRLGEVVEGYQALGFEVHLEPFDPTAKGGKGCTVCFEVPDAAVRFKTVYTRKTSNRS